MEKYNREYGDVIHNIENPDEYRIVAEYVDALKREGNVEFIHLNINHHLPRKVGITITTIASGDMGKLSALTNRANYDLKYMPMASRYDYTLRTYKLEDVLKMSGYPLKMFRINLTDNSSAILYDRTGYFTEMCHEILKRVAYSRSMTTYEQLGTLDIEKEAPMVFGLKQE